MPAVPAHEPCARSVAGAFGQRFVTRRLTIEAKYFSLPHLMARPCSLVSRYLHQIRSNDVTYLPVLGVGHLVKSCEQRTPHSHICPVAPAVLKIYKLNPGVCHVLHNRAHGLRVIHHAALHIKEGHVQLSLVEYPHVLELHTVWRGHCKASRLGEVV